MLRAAGLLGPPPGALRAFSTARASASFASSSAAAAAAAASRTAPAGPSRGSMPPSPFEVVGPAGRAQSARREAQKYQTWVRRKQVARERITPKVQVVSEEVAAKARAKATSTSGELVVASKPKAVQVRQNPKYAPNPRVPWERQLKPGSNNWRKRRQRTLQERREFLSWDDFDIFTANTTYDPVQRFARRAVLPQLDAGQVNVKTIDVDYDPNSPQAQLLGTKAPPVIPARMPGGLEMLGGHIEPELMLGPGEEEDFSEEDSLEAWANPRLGGARVSVQGLRDPSTGSEVRNPAPAVVYGQSSYSQPDLIVRPQCVRVAIIGTPNAGKSTLLNEMVSEKISAVSQKVNTTRGSVIGVTTQQNIQVVFQDTPGVVHKEHTAHLKRLSASAIHTGNQSDIVMVVMDCVKRIGLSERELLMKARRMQEENPLMELVLVLNKVDLSPDHERLVMLAQELCKVVNFAEVFYVSAAAGDGTEEVLDYLLDVAPFREWEYGEREKTPLTPLERVQEIIKEKLFHYLHQEIPYQVIQENMGWTELENGKLRIDQKLSVPKNSQREIMVGANGGTIRAIGRAAAADIERLLNRKVNLVFHCISLQQK